METLAHGGTMTTVRMLCGATWLTYRGTHAECLSVLGTFNPAAYTIESE